MTSQQHPKFNEHVLPDSLEVQYEYYHNNGVRQIVIAKVVSLADFGHIKATGMAICSPTDTYDRLRGQEIAKGRAVKQWWTQQAGARYKAAGLKWLRNLPSAFMDANGKPFPSDVARARVGAADPG